MPRQASASALFHGGQPTYLFILDWLIVIVGIIKAKLLSLLESVVHSASVHTLDVFFNHQLTLTYMQKRILLAK